MVRRYLLLALLTALWLSVLVLPVSAAVSQYNFTDGDYTYHIFNGTGSVNWTPPAGVSSVWYLAIGGGGGGGGGYYSGGGGAGGLVNGSKSIGTTVNVTVGAGGSWNSAGAGGTNGSASYFDGVIAYGGGLANASRGTGNDGGSGGGGSGAGGAAGGSNISGQGWAGGSSPGSSGGGGGGGGAAQVGQNGGVRGTYYGGNGGNGTQNNITGNNTWYCGGGGGGGNNGQGGVAGNGGGGAGGGAQGSNATYYGGGGGGSSTSAGAKGGYGFNGVVIVKYITNSAPVSTFTTNVTSGAGITPVLFTDTSVPTATSWNWSFQNVTGNNTQVWFSTTQNHTYSFGPGNFLIKLNATNGGGSNISSQTTFINVTATPPVASFTSNVTSGAETLPVLFTDSSTNAPATWSWSFQNTTGNNTRIQFSTTQNPVYSFNFGNYSIKLNVTNIYGDNSSAQTTYINVSSSIPVSSFTANTTGGTEPIATAFTDTTTHTPTAWSWSFTNITGNNTPVTFSTTQNPSHVFMVGNYKIILTSSNAFGSNASTQVTFVNVTNYPTPSADFIGTPTNGSTPLSVQFNDTSTGTLITTYAWTFGDGITASDQNPTHIYAISGLYNVSLTVTNLYGYSDTETKNGYIRANYTSPNSTSIDIVGKPEPKQFRVQTIWGVPIAGATVSVQGLETTTGSWDWLQELLGIPFDKAPIQNTLMDGTTDSQGNIEFLMVSTIRYNISTTAAGYTFAPYYITPHDGEYTIVANPLPAENWTESSHLNESGHNITVQSVYYTDSIQGINVFYNDTTGTTTGGFINISINSSTNWSFPVTGNASIHQNFTVPIGGTSAKVTTDIITSTGNILKTYGISFEGPAVVVPIFDEQLVYWGAMGLILLTGMMATATTSPQVSVMVCIEAWIFLAIGWLRPLEDTIGRDRVALVLTFATCLCIFWVLRAAKRQETGR